MTRDDWLRRKKAEHNNELVRELSSQVPRRDSVAETAIKMLAFENHWTMPFSASSRIDLKITVESDEKGQIERIMAIYLTSQGLVREALVSTWPADKTKGTWHTIKDLDELGLLLLVPHTDLGPDNHGKVLGE